jgi:DNA polymerase I-like protein with 3'-5' exonuclease and polymerase domains
MPEQPDKNKKPYVLLHLKNLVSSAFYEEREFMEKYYNQAIDMAGASRNIIVCIEGGVNYRLARYTAYKKTQIEEEVRPAYDQAILDLRAKGCLTAVCEGVEAQDMIAMFCHNFPGKKVIYTQNKAMGQLNNNATVFVLRNGEVDERFNESTPFHLAPLYTSLVGSGSIKGVTGFGKKAWDGLLEAWGVDGLEHLAKIAGEKDGATFNKINSDLKGFGKIRENFHEWLSLYDISQLHPELAVIEKVQWNQSLPTGSVEKTLVTTDNVEEAGKKFQRLLSETTLAAFDYETTDYAQIEEYREVTKGRGYVDMIHSEITGCSFAVGANGDQLFYLSVDHKDTQNLDKHIVLDWIRQVEDRDIPMVVANAMFEATVTLCQLAHDLKYTWDTTRLLHHHINENEESHALKFLSGKYLNYTQIEYSALLDQYGVQNMSQLTAEQAFDYACDDSLTTLFLHNLFQIQAQLKGNWDFIRDYEFGCVKSFVYAHVQGCKVSNDVIARLSGEDKKASAASSALVAKRLQENAGVNPLRGEAISTLLREDQPYEEAKIAQAVSQLSEGQLKELSSNFQSDNSLVEVRQQLVTNRLEVRRGKLYSRYKEVCEYTPPSVEVFEPTFNPTYKNLNQVCGRKAIPGFPLDSAAKASKRAVIAYLNEPDESEDHSEFKALLESAWSTNWILKELDGFLIFQKYCTTALGIHATEVVKGTQINVASSTWLKCILYVFLALPIRSRVTPKWGSIRMEHGLEGSPGTDEYAIELALANDCSEDKHQWKRGILENILVVKKCQTRNSNYWKVYPLWVEGARKAKEPEGMIHPGFSSCGTVTRRPTGSSPNLMQIEKGDVKQMFVPRHSNSLILCADFSAQELKITADLSGDPTMLSAYIGDNKKDLHALCGTAIVELFLKQDKTGLSTHPDVEKGLADGFFDYELFMTLYKDAEHDLFELIEKARYAGKTINFLSIYGGGPDKLSRAVGCPIELAVLIFAAQAKVFEGLGLWKAREIRKARKTGYVKTSYGNYRHVPGIASRNRQISSRQERQAINSEVQGTAADILKVALCNMQEKQLFKDEGPWLIATVYDEVVCDVLREQVYTLIQGLKGAMNITAPGHRIPMEADFSIGQSWGEQIELGPDPSRGEVNEVMKELT